MRMETSSGAGSILLRLRRHIPRWYVGMVFRADNIQQFLRQHSGVPSEHTMPLVSWFSASARSSRPDRDTASDASTSTPHSQRACIDNTGAIHARISFDRASLLGLGSETRLPC